MAVPSCLSLSSTRKIASCQVHRLPQDQAIRSQSSKEEKDNLDSMLLLMVDEPLVIVVKLADRLHNMRTAYALAPNKRRAVATETLEVWCTLAERLGMFAIKASQNRSPCQDWRP